MADLRRCIGSTRFGIEAHEAPISDFPRQPSQKDGYGRMCTKHWNAYTAGLARDAKARRAAQAEAAEPTGPVEGTADIQEAAIVVEEPAPKRTRRAVGQEPTADDPEAAA